MEIASSFTSSWSALQPEGQHLVDKESRNKTEGERIADEIGRAFSGDAWHGPSLNALLGGLSAREALQRPIPAAHTRNAPQSDRSVSAMLHGVTQHDAYHGGQIAILRKSVTPHQRRTAI